MQYQVRMKKLPDFWYNGTNFKSADDTSTKKERCTIAVQLYLILPITVKDL